MLGLLLILSLLSYNFASVSRNISDNDYFTFPLFVSSLRGESFSPNQISVFFNTTHIGYVFCSWKISNVKKLDWSRRVRQSTMVNPLVIDNLLPDTSYEIWCGTESFSGAKMARDHFLQIITQTSCCGYLTLLEPEQYIFEYPSRNIPETIFTVSYVGYMTNNIPLAFVFQTEACLSGATGSSLNIYPKNLIIDSANSSYSSSFVIRGKAGCYSITVSSKEPSLKIHNATFSVEIANAETATFSPSLASARYDSLSSDIVVKFDSSTDMGVTMYSYSSESFVCSNILSFLNDILFLCKWIDERTLHIITSNLLSSISLGTRISIVRGKVYPKRCLGAATSCLVTFLSSTKSVQVEAPSHSISPLAIVKSHGISSCQDFVFDISYSTGNSGFPWKAIQWTVYGLNSTTVDYYALENYLNSKYSTATVTIKIPLTFLAPNSQFSISVTLTNTYDKTGFGSLNVVVPGPVYQNQFSVVGSPSRLMYPSSSSIFEIESSVSNCSGFELAGNSAQWLLFDLFSVIPISTFTGSKVVIGNEYLRTGMIYFLNIFISNISIAVIEVAVSSYNPEITFHGGSSMTIFPKQGSNIDISAAVNVMSVYDNISYQWGCFEVSPNYGSSCSLTLNSKSPSLSLSTSSFIAGRYYSISLTAISEFGMTNTANLNLVAVINPIGNIFFSTNRLVLSRQDSVLKIGATIIAPNVSVLSWSMSTFSLSNFTASLSPMSQLISAGSFQTSLIIAKNVLHPGLLYHFSLSSVFSHVRGVSTSTSMIDVIVNSPPQGGTLSMYPTSGRAASTVFEWNTWGWIDDLQDYPLLYQFSYYIVSTTDKSIVQPSSEDSWASSLIGQGIVSAGNIVHCIAECVDSLGGTNVALFDVVVSSTSISNALFSTLQSRLDRASSFSESASYMFSVTRTLRNIGCSVPISCSTLNREDCSNTPKTCGPCKEGFEGYPGDSNLPCSLSSALPIGVSGILCAKNASCISNICRNGRCQALQKSCPNDCNGQGTCSFVNTMTLETTNYCDIEDPMCFPICFCTINSFGSDCSISRGQGLIVMKSKELICSKIMSMSSATFSSNDLMSFYEILFEMYSDPSTLSDWAFQNCTSAAVLAAAKNTYSIASSDLLNVIAKAYSYLLRASMFKTTSSLSIVAQQIILQNIGEGFLNTLVLDQSPYGISTDFFQAQFSRLSTSQLFSLSLSPPIYPIFQEIGQKSNSLIFNSISPQQANLSASIVMFQYANVQNLTSISSPISLLIQLDGLGNPSTARKLSTSLENLDRANLSGVFSLYNTAPIAYDNYPLQFVLVDCVRISSKPYYITVQCDLGIRMEVECPKRATGVINATCPNNSTQPRCRLTSDTSAVASCEVDSFTSQVTMCRCNLLFSSNAFSNNSTSFVSLVVDVVSSYPNTSSIFIFGGPIHHSIRQGAISIVLVISTIIFVGLLLYLNFHQSVSEWSAVFLKGNAILKKKNRSIKGFFSRNFDFRFHTMIWYRKFLEYFLDLTFIFRNYHHRASISLGMLCIRSFVALVIVFFVATVTVDIWFPDLGICESYTSESQCLDPWNHPTMFRSCQWRSDNFSCEFPEIRLTTLQIFMISIGIAWVSYGTLLLFRDFDVNLLFWIQRVPYCQGMIAFIPQIKKYSAFHKDDFILAQSIEGTFRRAARLYQLQQSMDKVSLTKEIDDILGEMKDVQSRWNEKRLSITYFRLGDPQFHISSIQEDLCLWRQQVLESNLAHSRSMAVHLRTMSSSLETDDERESLLIRTFVQHCLPSYYHSWASELLFPELNITYFRKTFWIQLSFLVLAWLTVAINGALLGNRVTSLWMGFVLASLLLLLLVFPFGLACLELYLHGEMFRIIIDCVHRLEKHSKLLLKRTAGLLKPGRDLIHHFNPACRTARLLPKLPISRLLLSINDNDVDFLHYPLSTVQTLRSRMEQKRRWLVVYQLLLTWSSAFQRMALLIYVAFGTVLYLQLCHYLFDLSVLLGCFFIILCIVGPLFGELIRHGIHEWMRHKKKVIKKAKLNLRNREHYNLRTKNIYDEVVAPIPKVDDDHVRLMTEWLFPKDTKQVIEDIEELESIPSDHSFFNEDEDENEKDNQTDQDSHRNRSSAGNRNDNKEINSDGGNFDDIGYSVNAKLKEMNSYGWRSDASAFSSSASESASASALSSSFLHTRYMDQQQRRFASIEGPPLLAIPLENKRSVFNYSKLRPSFKVVPKIFILPEVEEASHQIDEKTGFSAERDEELDVGVILTEKSLPFGRKTSDSLSMSAKRVNKVSRSGPFPIIKKLVGGSILSQYSTEEERLVLENQLQSIMDGENDSISERCSVDATLQETSLSRLSAQQKQKKEPQPQPENSPVEDSDRMPGPVTLTLPSTPLFRQRWEQWRQDDARKSTFNYRLYPRLHFYQYQCPLARSLSSDLVTETPNQPVICQMEPSKVFQQTLFYSFPAAIFSEETFRKKRFRKKQAKALRYARFIYESPGFRIKLDEMNMVKHPLPPLNSWMIFDGDATLDVSQACVWENVNASTLSPIEAASFESSSRKNPFVLFSIPDHCSRSSIEDLNNDIFSRPRRKFPLVIDIADPKPNGVIL